MAKWSVSPVTIHVTTAPPHTSAVTPTIHAVSACGGPRGAGSRNHGRQHARRVTTEEVSWLGS